jgi:hypothetical protein
MVGLSSTLPLLVARVGANYQQLAVTADQLAVLADALDARTYLHDPSLQPKKYAGIGNLLYSSARASRQESRPFHAVSWGQSSSFVLL